MNTAGTTTPDAAKREAIIARAIRTFADEGFRHADVQAIADGAGVGKGTVYRYFGNKQDLFWAATFEVTERLERHIFAAAARAEGALAKVRAACVAYADFFEANPQYLGVLVQEWAEFRGSVPDSLRQYHNNLVDRFGEILREGIDAGEIHAVDVRKTMFALANLLYGTVIHACYHKGDETLTDLAQYAVDIFLEGIRAESSANAEGDPT